MGDVDDLAEMPGLFLLSIYPIRFLHSKGRNLNKNTIVFKWREVYTETNEGVFNKVY